MVYFFSEQSTSEGRIMTRLRTFRDRQLLLGSALVAAVTVAIAPPLLGADRTKPSPRGSANKAEAVEMFAAMQNGDIEVKLIPNNDKEANVVITNKTKRPLSVRLPDAFAGVPVLAQIDGLGGGGGRNDNDNNNNNQNQALGGGFGGGGLGGGLGGGGFGGGAFNIAPEKVGKLKVACVCLEHGKQDPNPRVAYAIKPIDSFTKDAKVHGVLKLLASGKVNQRIAQAAAWHFANRMTWEQLAAKKIDRLGRPDEPYFNRAELQRALQLAAHIEQVTKEKPETTGSAPALSQR
jgi:hypothetical protein